MMKKTILRIVAIGCAVTSSSIAWADPVRIDCIINFDVIFATGEVFRGSGSDIGEVEFVDLLLEEPDHTFEAVGDPGTSMDPNGLQCRDNGVITADIIGEGSALFDGEPGFSYSIEIEDNRPDEPLTLGAVLIQKPRRFVEDAVTLEMPQAATIPATLPVLTGAAGSGLALLSLDRVRCRYRGVGADYAFEACAGPGGHGLLPGDILNVTEARLRLITAERAFPVTTARVQLGSRQFGDADILRLEVFNSDGVFVHGVSTAVEIGDVEIIEVE